MTYVCATTLLLRKSLLDDDSAFKHYSRTKESLPLAYSSTAVSQDTTRFFRLFSPYGIAISILIYYELYLGSFPYFFVLGDAGSYGLVKKMEVELVIQHMHPTSIGNTFAIQRCLTHCSRRSSYLSTYADVPTYNFLQKRPFSQ